MLTPDFKVGEKRCMWEKIGEVGVKVEKGGETDEGR